MVDAERSDSGDGGARIAALLQAMTVAEKVSLLAGASMWESMPIERLGIPAIKVSDGPNGARGSGNLFGGEGPTSACFPAAIGLAATWDTDLLERIGEALAEETKTKGAHLLLAPTVNIHRSPLNGRTFECYSEDPYLSARLAVAYITGLQGQGIGATVKHYVCNDSEFQRNTISSDVDERTLREIYLPPFEAAVREAGSWAVMSSYNRVNGAYVGEHAALLREILKEEWGFVGIVMSDWFGTQSTVEAANNGLDLEMPGPPLYRGARLLEAVEQGEVRREAIDEAAARMLRLIERTGAFDQPTPGPERAEDRPEHRALLRTAAAEGIVLLKNAGDLLPLDAGRLTSLAIIGPNARTAVIHGGGSAQVNAHYATSPYDGIAARLGDRVRLEHALGCPNHKLLPRLDPASIGPAAGAAERGFAITFFANPDLAGAPVYETTDEASEQVWLGEIGPGVPPRGFSARLSGVFTPRESGRHRFSLVSAGLSRLRLDGRELIDNWTSQQPGESYFGFGTIEVTAEIELTAGRPHALELDYSSAGVRAMTAVRLGLLPPQPADAIKRAAALAARADVAILCVGTNGEWESEGFDRSTMELPGEQQALIERVAAANPRTIVVLQTGSPAAMPWLDRVPAVLQAWFPGQECGNAIADVLFGAVTPSGKLPTTFPVRLEDNPAFVNYPGDNGHVRYGEGIFVGYRYYEKKKIAPRFPFGFGLSYTTFSYGDLRLSAAEIGRHDRLTLSIDVTNTGRRAGQEIVQLYVRDPVASVGRPEKELKGFAKVALAPGETRTVELTLDRRSLAYWDDARHAWVAEAGEFEALVGASSADIRARAMFRLSETAVFGGTAP